MPRIYASNADPIDFCLDCFPRSEEEAYETFGDVGEGPDGRGNCFGYDCDHPAYEETDYVCNDCKTPLMEND